MFIYQIKVYSKSLRALQAAFITISKLYISFLSIFVNTNEKIYMEVVGKCEIHDPMHNYYPL
jgi:hypothetical protein